MPAPAFEPFHPPGARPATPAAAAAPPSFQPLAQDAPVPPAGPAPDQAPAAASSESPPLSPPSSPVVTLQREGDRITRINIECSCGQVHHLQCHYPED